MEKEFKGTTIIGVEKVDEAYIEKAINPKKEFKLDEKINKEFTFEFTDIKEFIRRADNKRVYAKELPKLCQVIRVSDLKELAGDKLT